MPTPRISIVIPYFDYRIEPEFFHSWTREQTCGHEEFELVVVSTGTDADLDAEVRRNLRRSDQFLVGDADGNRMHRFNAGAKAARGELLLLTEDHCIARPTCVQDLLDFFATSDRFAGCIRSNYQADTAIGHAEEWQCMQFIGQSHLPTWLRLQARGFAIRRQDFLALGGFPSGYGEFGTTALGIELAQKGLEIDMLPGIQVRHVNHNSLHGVEEDALAYFIGEADFRHEHSVEHCQQFIGAPIEWQRRHAMDRRHASLACRHLLTTLLDSLGTSRLSVSRRVLSALVRQIPTAIAGQQWHLFHRWRKLQEAKLKWRFGGRDADRRNQLFATLWAALASYGRMKSLANARKELPVLTTPTPLLCDMGSLPESHLIGFHEREYCQGKPFRWTDAFASIRFVLPRSAYRISLDTLSLRGPEVPFPLRCTFGRRSISRSQMSTVDGKISFELKAEDFLDATEQRLTLSCAPLRGKLDPRTLGLPISSMTFAQRGSRAVAA